MRGTDAVRVGPLRLVGSGLAEPRSVKRAAFACFGVAAAAGLVLVVLTGLWWLLVVGAACVLAAWYYTGGKRPYGYRGSRRGVRLRLLRPGGGVRHGLVQVGTVPWPTWPVAVGIGALACAILVANNLRDLRGDLRASASARWPPGSAIAAPGGSTSPWWVWPRLAVVVVAAATTWWALLGLVGIVLARPRRPPASSAAPRVRRLIAVLKASGTAELAYALGLAVGLLLA